MRYSISVSMAGVPGNKIEIGPNQKHGIEKDIAMPAR
jgi:hypothetical protein